MHDCCESRRWGGSEQEVLSFPELGVTENLLLLNVCFFVFVTIISQAPNVQLDFYPAVNQVIPLLRPKQSETGAKH